MFSLDSLIIFWQQLVDFYWHFVDVEHDEAFFCFSPHFPNGFTDIKALTMAEITLIESAEHIVTNTLSKKKVKTVFTNH